MWNWAGNIEYSYSEFFSSASVEELQEIVARLKKAKVLGTGHSFSKIAESSGTGLSLHRMKGFEMDLEKQTIRVQAGCRYGDISTLLNAAGLAFPNLASLPHISIAGAIATGTHGSGVGNGNLATSIIGITLVLADGSLKNVQKGDPEFEAYPVHLGKLGVVTEVEIQCVPAFQMRQTVFQNVPLGKVLANFDYVMSSGYSVSLFTHWDSDVVSQVWVKQTESEEPVMEMFGVESATRKLHPITHMPAENATDQLGVLGGWYERLAHFKLEYTPSAGEELQSEFFVPASSAPEAYEALREICDSFLPYLLVSEVRSIKGDELWMSPAYGRDSVGFHFTWKKDWDGVMSVLPLVEGVLAKYDARPHWGKVYLTAGKYEKADEFESLRSQLDPIGKFR